MRAMRAAFAALALSVVPVALSAQTAGTQFHQPAPMPGHPQPPAVHPQPPVRPHPRPPSSRNRNNFPIVIDGSVVDRYLATPAPAPNHTAKAKPAVHPFGQQVFETHSTSDN
jgi:hypothetical protein